MILLSIMTGFFFVTTCFFAFKSYVFGRIILNIQDAVDEALDILDTRYSNISEILKKPVFFDSVEVRQVIEEIGITREAILFIASKIENSQREEIDDKNSASKEEEGRKEE